MYDYNSVTSSDVLNNAMAIFGVIWIFCLAICVFMLVVYWKIYKKAGEPGWACLVPFYSSYVLFKIAFGNGWYFLLSLIPFVNVVASAILSFKLAKAFGKDIGWGFGLLFLSIVFYPLLAFGNATYIGVEK